jgi:hypothetical protein
MADGDQAALGIDVADFQAQGFAQAQAAGADRDEGDAMIQGRHGREEAVHLGGREHDGQSELGIGADQLEFVGPDAFERFFPEELEGADRVKGCAPRGWRQPRERSFYAVRWRQYWRNSSALTRLGALLKCWPTWWTAA